MNNFAIGEVVPTTQPSPTRGGGLSDAGAWGRAGSKAGAAPRRGGRG